MKYPKIPVVITSCCRINLLDKMLDSFHRCCLDKDLITDYFVFDDHSIKEELDRIQKKWDLKIFHNQYEGQAYSINFLRIQLDKMGIKWYLHLEDDWLFIKQDHFIRKMFDIAFDDDRIKNVVLRFWNCPHIQNNKLKYRLHVRKEGENMNTDNDWASWGYSFNPGLQHIPTMKLIGHYPEGIMSRNFDKEPAKKYYQLDYKRANLEDNYIIHTGVNHSRYEKRTVNHIQNWIPFYYLKQLQNRHKDTRCFIVGSAPSLLKMDLTKLKNEITFGSNQIYKFYNHGLPPVTYYHVGDFTCIPKIKQDKKDGFDVDNVGQRFYRSAGFWVSIYYLANANPYIVEDEQPIKEFKYDLTHPITHGNSITVESIAFAMYMGCNPIYIIGVDMIYQPDESGFTSFDYIKAIQAHHKIAEKSKQDGFTIYNAGIEGRLIAYPRIDYKELFSE